MKPIGEFYEAFTQLRWLCNGDKTQLKNIAKSEGDRKFLWRLIELRCQVHEIENDRTAFVRRARPGFRSDLEIYDQMYEPAILDALNPGAREWLDQRMSELAAERGAQPHEEKTKSLLEPFDPESENAAELIEALFVYVFEHAADSENPFFQSAFDAWEWLRSAGLSLERFERRVHECGTVFMPETVHRAHARLHHASLIWLLEEARRAYISGASIAAIMTLRTVMEVMLRDHLVCGFVRNPKDSRGELAQMIDAYKSKLAGKDPELIRDMDDLHKIANAVVHANRRSTATPDTAFPRYLTSMVRLIEMTS